MRRLVVILAVLALLGGVSGAAAGLRGGSPPQFPTLPGNWSHAEINIKVKRVPHTLILDRGRIIQVSATQLTLREPDGSIVPIQLAPTTIYAFRGFGVRPRILRRGLFAETMLIDEGAAVRVRLSLRA